VIISRVQAEQAAEVLRLAEGLDGLTPEVLKVAYRAGAARTHPDRGGTAEAFAEVDRAKCILERWLERQGPEPAPNAMAYKPCPNCHGTGRVRVHRGFMHTMAQCHPCKGTGDGNYEHDRTTADR
jgi:DnaJ-class molecular chaperone